MIQQQDKKIHELILKPDEIDQDLICVICQELVIEPKECSLCSHLFCSKCIIQWLKNQIICPYKCSNNQLILKNHNRIIKNQIDKTILKCPNQHQGCEANFDLGLYDTHLIQCEYAQVKCQFVNYNFENIRKIVQIHEQTCEFKDDPQNIILYQQLLQQQREEQLEKQKEEEAKKLLHFCIQGHVLEQTYLMESAKCGNYFRYIYSRYICRVCNSEYCVQFYPIKINIWTLPFITSSYLKLFCKIIKIIKDFKNINAIICSDDIERDFAISISTAQLIQNSKIKQKFVQMFQEIIEQSIN